MIREKYEKFVQEYGHEPGYACAEIRWKDGDSCCVNFKMSCDSDENDDMIFFYVNGVNDLESLAEEDDNVQDFVINPEAISFFDEL